jgi:hypothetical protein
MEEVKKDHILNFGIYMVYYLIFSLIWFIAGIVGFVMSMVCCFYNGSISDKFIGILSALILGPFYWLFFIYNLSYCTRFNQHPVQQPYYE